VIFAIGVWIWPVATARVFRNIAQYIDPQVELLRSIADQSPDSDQSATTEANVPNIAPESSQSAPDITDQQAILDPSQNLEDVARNRNAPPSLDQQQWPTEWIKIDILGKATGGHSGSIILPVRIFNGDHVVTARMLFDTGATYTTLTRDILAQLGISISSQSPRIVTQTANGSVERRLVTVDAIAVGMAEVRTGLTIGACEDCGNGDIAGLLGLNFSRHFKVMVDHEKHELKLAPKFVEPSNAYDIRPFLDLEASRAQRRGEHFEIDVTVTNRSERNIVDATISAVIGKRERRLSTDVPSIPAGATLQIPISGNLWISDPSYRLELSQATW